MGGQYCLYCKKDERRGEREERNNSSLNPVWLGREIGVGLQWFNKI
jgi:hypothetical protein